MFLLIKRILASNKFFWKYRHLFQKKIFSKSYGTVPKVFFDNTFKNFSIKSILDFGCATGDKLLYFVKKETKNIYAIDINQVALKTAKKKLQTYDINCKFSENISEKEIKKFIKKKNFKKFDLVILDRVMYILNSKEFYKVVEVVTKITKYIYVNDFFLHNSSNINKNDREYINVYVHSNFDKILKSYNFSPYKKMISPYTQVKSANSKSKIYKFSG